MLRTRRGPASTWRGLRRVRPLLVTLLVVAALPLPAASAATLPALTNDVTVTAPRTGYLRVRLTRTVDLTRFNIYVSPPVFSGAGATGMALLPDRPGSTARNVVIARVKTDVGYTLVESQAQGSDPVTGEQGAMRLRPGVYRLFFLTRGGGQVRLRMPGLPSGPRRLTARTPVPWVLGDFTAPLDAHGNAPSSWEPTLDFASRQPGHLFAAMWFHSTATAYFRAGACYYTDANRDARGRPLCVGGYDGGGFERPLPYLDRHDWLWHSSIYDRAPGKQAVRLYYANAGRVESAGALMFFLPWS
ncbi:MAG TPA: hypothetical protein VNA20_15270 [Frankiaceae bacterium]|nr:hypothetical protein [Frankiaceae bacterium]